MKTISFFDPQEKNGYLANFSHHSVCIDGECWKTVEHFYQAQKFVRRPRIMRAIRDSKTPSEAKSLAKRYKRFRRPDWSDVKVRVMRRAIREKFMQHPDLARNLLMTGAAKIVEQAADNSFWGIGADGNGLNKMGQIIMQFRNQVARGL